MKKSLKQWPLFLVFLSVAVSAAQLPVTDDAYTSSKLDNQNFNFGKNAPLVVSSDNTAYLKFSLAALPPGTSADQVSKATVALWVSKISSPGTFDVRRVLGAWSEETITHNASVALGATEAAGVTAEESSFVQVDVTALVREWINGAPNDGVALVANTGFSGEFDSKENTGTGHEARLDVDLTSLVAGSGISITGLGSSRTVTNAGVTSLAGGTGITSSAATGSVTVDLAGSYRLPQSCANGQIAAWNGSAWACAADSIGNGWGLSGNAGTTSGSQFLGTTDHETLEIRVNNVTALRITPPIEGDPGEPTAASVPNIVGGAAANRLSGTVDRSSGGIGGATIGGGGDSDSPNYAKGNFATIGGGLGNSAGSQATVGGGNKNAADGVTATVAGGNHNTASGQRSMIPGGHFNTAAGDYSFAAGMVAQANHTGAFVWADARGSGVWSFASTAAHEFSARATGGVRFVTGIDSDGAATAGAQLASGSGSWSSLSDRGLKEDFGTIESRDVLERLVRLPIETWRYKAQDQSIRHIGPMAQDFYAAFGLGEDERHISSVDADGVAFAAIQGLYQVVQEKDAKIASLEARLEALEQAIKAETASKERADRP